jgi:hypothetical protein
MSSRQILCPVGFRCRIDMQSDAAGGAYCRGPSQGDGRMQSEMWVKTGKDSCQNDETNEEGGEEEDDAEEKDAEGTLAGIVHFGRGICAPLERVMTVSR